MGGLLPCFIVGEDNRLVQPTVALGVCALITEKFTLPIKRPFVSVFSIPATAGSITSYDGEEVRRSAVTLPTMPQVSVITFIEPFDNHLMEPM